LHSIINATPLTDLEREVSSSQNESNFKTMSPTEQQGALTTLLDMVKTQAGLFDMKKEYLKNFGGAFPDRATSLFEQVTQSPSLWADLSSMLQGK
jgi:hypothetical protein